jgi:hypothetical protein
MSAVHGKQIVLEFTASKIDSADLTILIDTSNGQHAPLDLDLCTLR